MKTISKTIYTFDELPEDIQAAAIEKNRNINLDYYWWSNVYEDVKDIGKIIGIEIENIYFSGFSSQGDGACFEGEYKYKKGAAKEIKQYAPMDEELHRIAAELQKIQRPNFYALSARVKQSGRYSHKYCTIIEVFDDRDGDYASVKDDEAISELLRDFMEWIYRQLESDSEYRSEDDAVKEYLIENEIELEEDGSQYIPF